MIRDEFEIMRISLGRSRARPIVFIISAPYNYLKSLMRKKYFLIK